MMSVAGVLGVFLDLIPPARVRELSERAARFYGFWVLAVEFRVALLLHLRSDARRLRACCPQCGGAIAVRFDPSGREFVLACPGWHAWSSLPLLVSPPPGWQALIDRPCWEDAEEAA
jgi:hypothetical protein